MASSTPGVPDFFKKGVQQLPSQGASKNGRGPKPGGSGGVGRKGTGGR